MSSTGCFWAWTWWAWCPAGGLFKMGARPTLKLCASSVRCAGGDWLKMELSASLTQKVANMLPADFRNMPDQWVKHVDGKMQSTLETCGGKGKVIISDLANLLISLGSGNFSGYVKQHVPQAPVKYHLRKPIIKASGHRWARNWTRSTAPPPTPRKKPPPA